MPPTAPTAPDPLAAAKMVADRVNADRKQWLVTPIDRVLTDSPFVDRASLVDGLEAFHKERMSKRPSVAKYPESTPWVDYALKYEAELVRLASLSAFELATLQSLGSFTAWRGFAQARIVRPAAVDEKCRVAFVPDTELGRVHIKNVDDPITHWKPQTDTPQFDYYNADLVSDGVGSGLHMDIEPLELFPLPALTMYKQYATDVPGAVDFLRRYSSFWGGGNLLVRDKQNRSAAIEKCSYSFFEVFYPGPDGRSHISGMTCRDPDSPQGRHQTLMRKRYVERFNIGEDCADNAFWDVCFKCEKKLAKAIKDLGPKAGSDALINVFKTPYPEGLNKTGMRLHPKQGLLGYTLITQAVLLDKREIRRWQRSQDGKTFAKEPEIYKF
jgi:hypothetical protein